MFNVRICYHMSGSPFYEFGLVHFCHDRFCHSMSILRFCPLSSLAYFFLYALLVASAACESINLEAERLQDSLPLQTVSLLQVSYSDFYLLINRAGYPDWQFHDITHNRLSVVNILLHQPVPLEVHNISLWVRRGPVACYVMILQRPLYFPGVWRVSG